LFAIVGGALAIKANRGQGNVYTWNGQTFVRIEYKTTAPSPLATLATVYTTTLPPKTTLTYITTVPVGM
jgi:hypothetical protein